MKTTLLYILIPAIWIIGALLWARTFNQIPRAGDLRQTQPPFTSAHHTGTPALTFAHDAYLDAIEMQESSGDPNAEGDLKNGVYRAIGSFQLWKIYVDDFNRIQLLNRAWHQATYEDRWDPVKSRKITAVVTAHYANHDWWDKASHAATVDRNSSQGSQVPD